MEILSRLRFKNKFRTKKISFIEFKNNVLVNYKNPLLIRELIKNKKISNNDAKFLYDIFFVNRDKLLDNIYSSTLEPIEFNKGELKDYKSGKIFHSNIDRKQKNLIKNINFDELYLNTIQGIDSALPNYYHVLKNIYSKLIFDPRLVCPSGLELMKKSVGSLLSGFYFRASVYNPVMLYWIFENVIKPKKLLTPTLGWNSYLIGALEYENLEKYVGIDVIPSVCDNARMIGGKKTTIYCKPSESLIPIFKKKYSNYFDSVFFSPPFFDLEQYSGDNQSTKKYPEKESWLNNYWRKTCELCYISLGKKGKFTYITSNYGKHKDLKSKMYKIAKEFFIYDTSYKIYVNKNGAVKHNNNHETLYIFIKK
jgi:hypothetical protein